MSSTEESSVLSVYEKMQQAMIDKDIGTLSSAIKDGTVFTHMSGKKQSKDEYLGEIADGTLNYYRYSIDNPVIRVDGDTSSLTADVTLKAVVYGISGSWTLHVNAYFTKENGNWLYCNK